MYSSTSTLPYSQTRPRSLRPRSTSITCSARSFGIGEQGLGLAPVLLLGGAARIGAGDRPRLDPAAADLDQRLGRGAGDLEVAELEEVHVRRGVDRPQAAVDRERLDRRRRREALRGDDLERVAGVHVLDDPRDVGLEVLAREVRPPRSIDALGLERRRRRRPVGDLGRARAGGTGPRSAARAWSITATRPVIGRARPPARRRRRRSRARSPRAGGGRRRASARRPSATCRAGRADRGSARRAARRCGPGRSRSSRPRRRRTAAGSRGRRPGNASSAAAAAA